MHTITYFQVIIMVNILGFNIIDCSMDDYIKSVMEGYRNKQKRIIVSGNPEVLNTAINDDEIAALCRASDIIPDGIGVVAAGRITNQHFKQKIAGIEVVEEILKLSQKNGIRIYLLGAEEWVVKKAADECFLKYNSIIAGCRDGYFSMDNCSDIIDEINKSKADAIFIGMGCPRQERFISRFGNELSCRIIMGVGGSFDVLSGKVNRAPSWMIRLGLEWLYRVSKEPARIIRLKSIPVFLFKVLLRNRRKNIRDK